MDLEAYFEVASIEELQGVYKVAGLFNHTTCNNRQCSKCPIRELCVFMTAFEDKYYEEGFDKC